MNHRQQQMLAAYIHGVLSFGHAIGCIYNYSKGNKKDTVIHALSFAYDVRSTIKHIGQC